MHIKTYLVLFKKSDMPTHLVIAASAELHGEHLVFLHADGRLVALFVLEVVESWAEIKSQNG